MAFPASSLWLTLPAPARWAAAGWIAWLLATALAGRLLVVTAGPFGVASAVVIAGVWLARRFPGPLECFCRHHLDDTEITRMGPGRSVARLEWSEVGSCAQARHALVLAGGGRRIALPLRPLIERAGWAAVLSRVVPPRAEALWRALEGGAVALVPALDPPLARVGAWCWAPAAAAAVATGDPLAGLLAAGLAAVERAVVAVRRRLRTVILQPGGLVVTGPHGRFFAPWDSLTVEPAPNGLTVRSPRGTGFVPADLDDFWAAAAVIELHAQLGFRQPDVVRFRVHVDGTEIAVVGEVEAA
jgi:hypothetical protein